LEDSIVLRKKCKVCGRVWYCKGDLSEDCPKVLKNKCSCVKCFHVKTASLTGDDSCFPKKEWRIA